MTSTPEIPSQQPLTPEQKAQQGLAELNALLTAAETSEAAGQIDPNATSLIVEFAAVIQKRVVHSGGFTIQGTDEWIPGEATPHYSYEIEDGNGGTQSVTVDRSLGERLETYKAKHAHETADHKVDSPERKDAGKDSNTKAPSTRQMAAATHKRDAISDLVKLDATGRTHYESGIDPKTGKKLAGRFMTKHELDTIEAFADEIRGGIKNRYGGDYSEINDLVGVDSKGRRHVPKGSGKWSGKMLSKQNMAMIAAHQEQIRNGLAQEDTQSGSKDVGAEAQAAEGQLTTFDNEIAAIVRDSSDSEWGETTLVDTRDRAIAQRTQGKFAHARTALKNLYDKAGAKVSAGFANVMDKLTDEEKGRRRRGILAGVVGVGLVALAYGASRGFHLGEVSHTKGGGENQDVINALSGKGSKSGSNNSDIINALGGGQKGQHTHEATTHAVKLTHGDSIWAEERKLHPHANEAQIRAYTQRALDINHLNWEQARQLAEGEEVKLI